MPRRTRKRCVGKWEQIEQEAREEELRGLEREVHGERQSRRKPKPKRRKAASPPEQKEPPDNEHTNSDG